ncbi:FUSC family protein [Longispora fulva]|uniref:MFS family permease n=1 Tax=Longispora fulva TaxID=619741 RepID=A0A8J7KP08_9ACTN|nr:FUSC family protein [Longispora fulva]MBG6135777.1 MFS family permease [Longispora fulva]
MQRRAGGVIVLLVLLIVPTAALDRLTSSSVAVAFLLGVVLFGPVRLRHGPRAALVTGGGAALVVTVANLLGGHPWALAALVALATFAAGLSARWGLHSAVVLVPVAGVVLHAPTSPRHAVGLGVALFAGAVYGIVLLGGLHLPAPAPDQAVTLPGAAVFGVVLAMLTGPATLVTTAAGVPHGYWVALTILMVVQPSLEASRRRAVERIVGNVLGAVAAAVTTTVITNNEVLLGLGLLLGVASAGVAGSYTLQSTLLTMSVVLLVGGHDSGESTALLRLALTVTGGVAVLAACFVLPRVLRLVSPGRAPDNETV